MALTKPIGFLCYNNSELVRDGYIEPSMSKEIPAEDFNFNLLKRNRKGISYQIKREDPDDPTKITSVIETRKILPAEKLKIEIQFSKTLKNAVTSPIAPGAIPGSVGFLVGNPLAGVGFGGITSGFTDFVYGVIDSKMFINKPITVTQQILDTGFIEFDDFPVSVFGIVREYREDVTDPDLFKEDHPEANIEIDSFGGLIGRIGLDFQGEQLERIGQHSRGSYQGGPRKRIDGITNKEGQYGDFGIPYLNIVANSGDSGEPPEQEVVLLEGQSNIFLEIFRDYRKTKFRGDNRDACGARFYPFKHREVDDNTDRFVRINVSDLNLDDTIYITYCGASERRVRQAMRHKGIVGQGNSFGGVTGWNLEIGTQMDVFDYQIRNWIVPLAAPASFDSTDNEFKITHNQYVAWKQAEESLDAEQSETLFNNTFYELEGWRMSSVVTERLEYIWAADYRGIVLMGDRQTAVVVVPYAQIRDKEWFVNYVKGLDFIEKHEDPSTGEIIYDNLQIKIDDAYNRLSDMPEAPIDTGDFANALLFDREKIPYYRPFAIALQYVSEFNIDDPETGIGTPSLDVALKFFIDAGVISGLPSKELYAGELIGSFNNIQAAFLGASWNDNNLRFTDLSFSKYNWVTSVSNPSFECAEMQSIKEHHYNCHTYDPAGGVEGSGIWLSSSYIENSLFGWRPPGGFIESYWKMDTPYFCGDFKRDSRIYIEKVGGNSLDNYSWIYADTRPDMVDSISVDRNVKKDKSYLSFYDNLSHNSLSYHILSDSVVRDSHKYLEYDFTRNHTREFLEDNDDNNEKIDIHYNQIVIGYNSILGDSPSFNVGKPITNLESKMEHDNNNVVFVFDILNNPIFDLNFSDDIPKVTNIPFYWTIKSLDIEYSVSPSTTIKPIDAYSTIYFDDNNTVVNNFTINKGPNADGSNRASLDCAYYGSGTIEFIGESWKKARFDKIDANIVDEFVLRDYKIDEGQSSIVSDGNGKVLVFFADSKNGNISVAVSNDDTDTWEIYRDIIRLLSNESASLPIALQDSITGSVHLFYVLNDAFLMYKRIDTNLFVSQDVWVDYVPPEYYNEASIDDIENNPTSSLYNYTSSGKRLRQETSYFVIGDSSSSFFVEQVEINNTIIAKNRDTHTNQTIRFQYGGTEDIRNVPFADYDETFNGKSFAVNKDNSGLFRIFFTESSGFSVKISSDSTNWEYVARNLPIHKTHFDDIIKEENNPVITNIQIAKNYYDEKTLNLFYFYNSMLFMRRFSPNEFKIKYDKNGEKDDTEVRNLVEINPNIESSRPLFIVGNIPDDILQERIFEITSGVIDSAIAILFPYTAGVLIKFDSTMAIDDTTQVGAYVSREGEVKVIYKDYLDKLNGVSIQGINVKPEIFYKAK